MKRGIVVLVCITVSGWTGATQAATVAVVNPGFELDENGMINNTDEFTALQGWNSAESGFGGQHNDFTAADNNGNSVNFPGEPQDSRQGHINADNGPLSQQLAATFIEGLEYTLTVGVGRREDHDDLGIGAANWSISLRHDSGAIAGGGVATLSGATVVGQGGILSDQGFTFTALASDAGQAINVVLSHEGSVSGGFSAVNFENVRLSAVPEPSALLLVGMGVAGWIGMGWRRR